MTDDFLSCLRGSELDHGSGVGGRSFLSCLRGSERPDRTADYH